MHARTLITTLVVAAIASGCGGDSSEDVGRSDNVSAKTRIEKCAAEYPDSTTADCEEWEADGKLNDDGTHPDHENM